VSTHPQEQQALNILTPLLFNPARGTSETCLTCTTPTGDENQCHQCRGQRSQWGSQLADIVVPLTYASDTATPQIRRSLKLYKDGWDEETRTLATTPLTWLVWHAIYRHGHCLEEASGGRIDASAVVPSGRVNGRREPHPIRDFGRYFPTDWTRFRFERISDASSRYVDPDTLHVKTPGAVAGKRVLLFDDTWTTGASAQGAAIAAKRAGAASVTIVVMGRWANDAWQPTRDFFTAHSGQTWSADVCPVTGQVCSPI